MIDLQGLPVILMDTAGLRENTADAVEAEGVARSRRAGEGADLVIWASATDSPTKPPGLIFSWCRARRISNWSKGLTCWRCRHSPARDSIRWRKKFIVELVLQGSDQGVEGLIAHQRHASCLIEAASALERSAQLQGATLDLRAEELRIASQAIDSLIGFMSPDDVLG